MDRKKSRESTDELAAVKAAAWAWYQHGSGSDPSPASEYDVSRTHRAYEPSRYKLEAMEGSQCSSTSISSPSHSDISLLDTYERERISKQLDYYIETSRLFGGDSGHRRVVSSPEIDVSGTKSKRKSKKSKGFWLRHGVVCGGSRNDVVERGGFGGGGRRPEKHVAVVGVANCRPWATHA